VGVMLPHVNVGCGSLPLSGYCNLDLKPFPEWMGRDDCAVCDVRNSLPFRDDTVAEIRGDQFPEHLTLPELAAFLQECRRVLVRGGELRFTFPDMVAFSDLGWRGGLDEPCRLFRLTPPQGVPVGLYMFNLVAGEGWVGHRCCLTVELLKPMVESAGFLVEWVARVGPNGLVMGKKQ